MGEETDEEAAEAEPEEASPSPAAAPASSRPGAAPASAVYLTDKELLEMQSGADDGEVAY